VPFNSISRLIGLARNARGGLPPRNGKDLLRPWTPKHLSPSDKMSQICLGRPIHQPIKLSHTDIELQEDKSMSTDYLATFTGFRSRTKIVGNVFDFATIFTRLTVWTCWKWKNWVGDWLSLEIMSKKCLPFPETQDRHPRRTGHLIEWREAFTTARQR